MKTPQKTLLLLTALCTPLIAGDQSKEVLPPPVDNPYFAGATIGYLDELDTEFYSLHLGKDLDNQFMGWDQALYLEIGYADTDGSVSVPAGTAAPITYNYGFELIPLTLNYKLEKEIAPNWNAYLGAGAGVAFTDSSLTSGGNSLGGSDTVFYAQGFAGLLYNINEKWEAYGGGRFIYFDDPDNAAWDMMKAAGVVDNTDWLAELGLRYNF